MLDWSHLNLDAGAMELAGDEEGRKPGGSWRIVPLVAPLLSILRQEWLAQGRPKKGKVCPPRRKSRSGLLAVGQLQRRVLQRWLDLGLEPIRLHEARHTAATWLDHASRPRSVHRSWATRRPSISPVRRGSPSSAIRTCFPASLSALASNWISSSPSARPTKLSFVASEIAETFQRPGEWQARGGFVLVSFPPTFPRELP